MCYLTRSPHDFMDLPLLSVDDKLEQQHSLFTCYKDPCRIGPGEDKSWAIGKVCSSDLGVKRGSLGLEGAPFSPNTGSTPVVDSAEFLPQGPAAMIAPRRAGFPPPAPTPHMLPVSANASFWNDPGQG